MGSAPASHDDQVSTFVVSVLVCVRHTSVVIVGLHCSAGPIVVCACHGSSIVLCSSHVRHTLKCHMGHPRIFAGRMLGAVPSHRSYSSGHASNDGMLRSVLIVWR